MKNEQIGVNTGRIEDSFTEQQTDRAAGFVTLIYIVLALTACGVFTAVLMWVSRYIAGAG